MGPLPLIMGDPGKAICMYVGYWGLLLAHWSSLGHDLASPVAVLFSRRSRCTLVLVISWSQIRWSWLQVPMWTVSQRPHMKVLYTTSAHTGQNSWYTYIEVTQATLKCHLPFCFHLQPRRSTCSAYDDASSPPVTLLHSLSSCCLSSNLTLKFQHP